MPKCPIETERLALRRLEPNDMDTYFERIYSDKEVMRTLPSGAPISRDTFDSAIPAFMIEHWEKHGFGPWVVVARNEDRLLGHCGLKYWPGTQDVEVLYALERPAWGLGIATEAARASVRFGFRELGLDRIIAGVLPHNAGSRRVLEKLCMRETGPLRLGDLEVVGYCLDRSDFDG